MSTTSDMPFTPAGWPTVIPRIVVDDTLGLVKFIKRVFGASGEHHRDRPAELRIGESIIMVSGTGDRPVAPAFLYVYVPDCDTTYRRAIDAGARAVEEPVDMPYGDRRGMVHDVWGNTWQIATHHAATTPSTPAR